MDKVTIQFEKLKSQGKINIAEKVKKSDVDTFEAGLFCKTIKYNKEMKNLSDDVINFWLLHEEGHFDNPNPWLELVYILTPSLLAVIVVSLFCLYDVTLITCTLFVLIFLIVIRIMPRLLCIWMECIYQNYEYKADDYACKNIDDSLRIVSVFKHTRALFKKKGGYIRKKLLYFGCSKYSHPSDEDRINRMKQNHDEIILLE